MNQTSYRVKKYLFLLPILLIVAQGCDVPAPDPSGVNGTEEVTGSNSENSQTAGVDVDHPGHSAVRPTPSPHATTAAVSSKWVMGYLVGYQAAFYGPKDVDFSGLTHLVVGTFIPQANGGLDKSVGYSGSETSEKFIQTAATLAHAAGRKVLMMIGGASYRDGWVQATSDQNRAVFVQNLLSTMNQYGYDGLDLDWEPLETDDYVNFKKLVVALRAASPKMILTMPVGWSIDKPDSFYGDISSYFDQINVMTYAMANNWQGWKSWHSSALKGDGPGTTSSVDHQSKMYLASGVPSAKLGVGIGFYGICWNAGDGETPVNQPRMNLNGSHVVAEDNVMSYANIMALYYSPNSRIWDGLAQVPYLSFSEPIGPSDCTFISYEDSQSIIAKGQYVKDHNMGGAIIWSLGEGFIPGNAAVKNPLLQATKKGFIDP